MLKKLLQRWCTSSPHSVPLLDNPDAPTEEELKHRATSEWIEYQAWLFHYSFLTQQDWQRLHATIKQWQLTPVISIITPVYNTQIEHLHACIRSVQTQVYPHWELCLVDDGSTDSATLNYLKKLRNTDSRLHIITLDKNQGICGATNAGIAHASGEYIAFLDHDDCLSVDALYYVAEALQTNPKADVLYSDRDMLSPKDRRFMHLFKPQWSPETLLSGNYLFHLMVYKHQLLTDLNGVRADYEGSQDYDLILRAADKALQVIHIPRILYHWRQHENSVSMAHDSKSYAYKAGVNALKDTLNRRDLQGDVVENTDLWRGNYQLQLTAPAKDDYTVIRLKANEALSTQINHACQQNKHPYLVFIAQGLEALHEKAIQELLGWFQISDIAMTTGKVMDNNGRLLHAGLIQRPQGTPLSVYEGFPEENSGYMAVTAITRNVSSPHPRCFALRRSVWEKLGGMSTKYKGEYSVIDFALRALAENYRTVYTPQARFEIKQWQACSAWSEKERDKFIRTWKTWLESGDPYYNPHLTLDLVDMGVSMKWLGH